MLFDDTVQCPNCQYVLDEQRYAETATLSASPVGEKPCPQCGEMVRAGLVRCWNCSAFINDEIAEAYREMRESPQPVIYSLLPDEAELRMVGDEEDESGFELGPAASRNRFVAAADSPPPPPPGAGDTGEEAADGRETPPPPDVAHSVATGGDALLEVARAEEREEKLRRSRRRAGPRSATGLLVYCPNGHRIEVDQKYRGMTGKCPKCKAPFFVPVIAAGTAGAPEAAEEEAAPDTGFGKYTHWLPEVHVHALNPERFKLKAGSLKNDYHLYEFAFGPDEILAATFAKKKGKAAVKPKKLQKDREALQEALRNGVAIADTPAVNHLTFSADQAPTIAVVQPAPYAHESMFAGIPVFGEGRIAVRLPAGDEPDKVRFASFTLSEFREFARLMNELYGIAKLGEAEGVPMTDTFAEGKCHYSEQKLSFLEDPTYHQADPAIELQLVGRKCQACGLVVSEDMRKKEKIGGANGKAIAKAKCPKCGQKFGDVSLFALEQPPEPASESADAESAEEEATSPQEAEPVNA